jgi:hypothetical protein
MVVKSNRKLVNRKVYTWVVRRYSNGSKRMVFARR